MKQRTVLNKRRNRKLKYIPIAVLLMALALLIGASVFFRVAEISVTGSTAYTSEEIVKMSGIEVDDNLLFINETAAAVSICNKFPYVAEVKIIRNLPNSVVIEIMEREAIASVTFGGNRYIIDKNAHVLESLKSVGTGDLINVTGLESAEIKVGQKIPATENNQIQLEYLTRMLTQISDYGMQNKIKKLYITSISAIEFDYDDKYSVKFGKGEDVDKKLSILKETVLELGSDEQGEIDLRIEGEAHFIPE